MPFSISASLQETAVSTIAKAIRQAGHHPELHWLVFPEEERWRRVNARDEERGETFAIIVTRQMFDFMEARYEVPSQDEIAMLDGKRLEGISLSAMPAAERSSIQRATT